MSSHLLTLLDSGVVLGLQLDWSLLRSLLFCTLAGRIACEAEYISEIIAEVSEFLTESSLASSSLTIR